MYAWIGITSLLIVGLCYLAYAFAVSRTSDPEALATRSPREIGTGALLALMTFAGTVMPRESQAQNVVTHWAGVIQPAISSAGAPRPPGSSEVLHAMVQLVMYDAVVAIQGGYAPYAHAVSVPYGADVRAAVATAAYRTAKARVAASQQPYLDWHYTDYLGRNAGGDRSAGRAGNGPLI